MAKKKADKDPEFITGTARTRFLGNEKDEHGRKIAIEEGEDVELEYRLALRLEASGKLALGDDRKEAKVGADTNAAARAEADQVERRRLLELDDRLEERDEADTVKKSKGKGKGKK